MMKLFKFIVKAEANHAFEYVVMAEDLSKAFAKLRALYATKYNHDLLLNEVANIVEIEGDIAESFC